MPPMKSSDRKQFNTALDTLADTLQVNQLESNVKDEFWESLKQYSHYKFVAICSAIQNSYEPKRSTDFPVLAVFHKLAVGITDRTSNDTWNCRCCGIPFQAGQFSKIRCACIWEYCYECGQCEKHCGCHKLTELHESKVWKAVIKSINSPIKDAFLSALKGEPYDKHKISGTRWSQKAD